MSSPCLFGAIHAADMPVVSTDPMPGWIEIRESRVRVCAFQIAVARTTSPLLIHGAFESTWRVLMASSSQLRMRLRHR